MPCGFANAGGRMVEHFTLPVSTQLPSTPFFQPHYLRRRNCHGALCYPVRGSSVARPSCLVIAATSSPSSSSSSSSTRTADKQRFFATCAPGLEAVVASELSSPAIAASDVKVGSTGVYFTGSLATAFNANLWLRCAIRVLAQLSSSSLSTRRRGKHDPVYEFIRESVDWPKLLAHQNYEDDVQDDKSIARGSSANIHSAHKLGTLKASQSPWRFRSFAVQTRMWGCQHVNNSMFASIRATDAICDSVRDACGGCKPDPPQDGGAYADVPLFLSLYKDQAFLYRDMSGISLHRRGYRDAMHRASLNEAIAAGVLTLAGWNKEVSGLENFNRSQNSESMSLLDPMCGSGTFLIEAALMACNKAPGLMRSRWPFQTWHDFDESVWKECKERAAAASCSPNGIRLLGNDIHEGALSLCVKDAKSAGVDQLLSLSCSDCIEYVPPTKPSLLVVNPPWGSRLETSSSKSGPEGASSWDNLSQFLKQRCRNTDAYVLSGNSTITRSLRMRSDRKWPITIGGVECKLLHYHVLPAKIILNDSKNMEI